MPCGVATGVLAKASPSDKIQLELLYSERVRELSYLSFLPTCRAREAHADGIINATPGRRRLKPMTKKVKKCSTFMSYQEK